MLAPTAFFAANVERTEERLRWIRRADLVVGIPSFQEADNIAFVVKQCDEGLRRYFPDLRSVIINVDNDSPDGTKEAFIGAGSLIPQVYITTPEGIRGKGNNFYNLWQAALFLKARAVVMVDADLTSITPEWIRSLASPILDHGCDYVTPLYSRNEYDGTITNHVCYPLLNGVLCTDLRQPIGGDFGMSSALAAHVLSVDWEDTTREYGIDIFLTLQALLGNFRIGQTTLAAKRHKPSTPKLGAMFTQVVGTLLSYLAGDRDRWPVSDAPRTIRVFEGLDDEDAQGLAVDYKAIKAEAVDRYAEMIETLEELLEPDTFQRIDEQMRARTPAVDARLWARVLYDLLYAFDTSDHRPSIVEAMKPLFFARVISFIRESLDLDHAESESMIVEQARVFRQHRDYLLGKYERT